MIQHSQESLRALAKRFGVNPETVAKWTKRSSVTDLPTGPTTPKSTVLSLDDEAVTVAFRRHTLLPLDDCLYELQATIPHLIRSSLHRCLQRHGISRLPEVEGAEPANRKFKAYPIGYFHIDIAEVRTEEGKLYLFVAIDRTSKFAVTELHEKATTRIPADFLRGLLKAVPYKIHTVLTDNGTHFTMPGNQCSAAPEIKLALERGEVFRAHAFEFACAQNDINHHLTKPRYPWTNGQVERMNRTLKEATVKRYHYDTHDQLRRHLAEFVTAYNFARRLKTLKGLTPYEYICQAWTKESQRFNLNPPHQMPGLNTKRHGTGAKGGLTLRPSGVHAGALTTKVVALVDALGNLVRFVLLPGQHHDTAGVAPLLTALDFGALLADKAFDSDIIRADLAERGAVAVTPPKVNRVHAISFDFEMYKWRHLVENFCKIKEFCRIATRYGKTDTSFSAIIHLVETVLATR
jgi:transposase InsO family protein/transposase